MRRLPKPLRDPEHVKCTSQEGGCEIGDLFRLLGKAHTLDILHLLILRASPLRFVEIQQQLKLSPNTLSDRLKELVQAGLLSKTSYNEIPPRVDYEVTRKARELEPVFESLIAWAKRNDLTASPQDAAEAAG